MKRLAETPKAETPKAETPNSKTPKHETPISLLKVPYHRRRHNSSEITTPLETKYQLVQKNASSSSISLKWCSDLA